MQLPMDTGSQRIRVSFIDGEDGKEPVEMTLEQLIAALLIMLVEGEDSECLYPAPCDLGYDCEFREDCAEWRDRHPVRKPT